MAHRVHTLQVEARRILISAKDQKDNTRRLVQLVTARIEEIVSKGRHKVAANHWQVSIRGKNRPNKIRRLLYQTLLHAVHKLKEIAELLRITYRRGLLTYRI